MDIRALLLGTFLLCSVAVGQEDTEAESEKDTTREILNAAKKGLVQSPTLVRNWMATLIEARSINLASGSKLRAIQGLKAYSILIKLSDPKATWDPLSVADLGLKTVSLANWVYGGAPIPYLAAITATLAVYKIPAVRSFFDERVFGSYLSGPDDEYPLDQFTNPKLVNKPYLICNRYESEDDIRKGNRPVAWDYATPNDNPDLKADFHSYDRLRRQNYIVVPGRWIRMRKGAFEYVVRFATTMNPLDLQLTCWNKMMSKVKMEEGPERTMLSLKTFELTVPHVGYSTVTLAYPIYFYSAVHEKDAGVEKRIAVRLVDQDESKKPGMQIDKTDYLQELISYINLSRLYAAPQRLAFINELEAIYYSYSKLQEMYNTKKILSMQELASLGLSTAMSTEAIVRTARAITDWQALHKFAFLFFVLNAAYTTASYAKNVPRALINKLGPVLDGPKEEYPLSEFTSTIKGQTANLACRYFGDTPKGPELLTWTWATQENGDDVPLKGRYIEDKSDGDASVFFGTLDDYVKLVYYCMAVSLPKVADRIQGKTVSRVDLASGSSKLDSPYPTVFYVPAHRENGEDAAVIFHPEKPAEKKE